MGAGDQSTPTLVGDISNSIEDYVRSHLFTVSRTMYSPLQAATTKQPNQKPDKKHLDIES